MKVFFPSISIYPVERAERTPASDEREETRGAGLERR